MTVTAVARPRGLRLAFLALLAIAAFGASAFAQDAAYLKALPAPAEIEAAFPIEGDDRIDAAAKQQAAFSLAADAINERARERKTMIRFTPEEAALHTAYSVDASNRIRKSMGYPTLGCGGDKDCERFDALYREYLWRSKKKSAAFKAEFREKFPAAAAAVLPPAAAEAARAVAGGDVRTTDWLLILAAVSLGAAAARPWKAVYRGQITQMGSGVSRTSSGIISETFNRRNRIKIGAKKLGETVTSMRMDDALMSAMHSGSDAAVGTGWVLWWRWILSVNCDGEKEREPFLSFLTRTLILSPLFAVVAALIAGFGARLFLPLNIAWPIGIFVLVFGLTQIVTNTVAWIGGAPAKTARAYAA